MGGAITLSEGSSEKAGLENWIGSYCFIAVSQLCLKACLCAWVCVCVMGLLWCCLLPRNIETPAIYLLHRRYISVYCFPF